MIRTRLKFTMNSKFFAIIRPMRQFLNKAGLLTVLLLIVLTLSFGAVLSTEMMLMDGGMHNCPFMGVPALCNMSPMEHLSQWQQMFATTLQQISTAALLLLLAVILLWRFAEQLFIPQRTEIFLPRYRYREKAFDPLRLAFARGIIHSKAY